MIYANRWFTVCVGKSGGWLRARDRLLTWTNLPPLSSERKGYRKPFLRIGKTRFLWEKY